MLVICISFLSMIIYVYHRIIELKPSHMSMSTPNFLERERGNGKKSRPMWKFTSDCTAYIFSLHLLIRGAIWVQFPMALDLLRWWHMSKNGHVSPSDRVQCIESTGPNPDPLISMLLLNVVLFMSEKMVLLFSFIVINDAWLINDINRSYMTGEKTIN